MNTDRPITESELHAFVDGQLPAERHREIETYLAGRADEAQRVEAYRAQMRELHALFDPVLDEQPPQRLLQAARPRTASYLQRLVAGLAIALVSGAAGWGFRGGVATSGGSEAARSAAMPSAPGAAATALATGFAQRAAVAHAVYSADARRPVEIDAAHEDQLVAWLSKRMGAPMKPPHLQVLGYELEGGRLLPGGQGPVAQFMYRNEAGSRLTLYVSNEIGDPGGSAKPDAGTRSADTAFRFAQQGSVNVFFWVERPFGYAISADADRGVLARVSAEVYQQLGARR